MNEFLKLLLPWREATNDQISDFFVYGILLFFIILLGIFLWKTIRRTRLIGDLTKEVDNLGDKYGRPADPNILNDLEETFERNDEFFKKAWQEFKESLITPERRKVVYKTDEASLFFSEERLLEQHLNLRFWNSVSALLVGLGILGTFVGLVWGLIPFSGIDFTQTEQIQSAIRELLSGVSTAFVTSVWGMLASLLFNGLEKWGIGRVSRVIADLQRALDLPFTLKTQAEIAEKQKDELEQQTAALKSFSTDLADRIKKDMGDIMSKRLDNLHDSLTGWHKQNMGERQEIIQGLRNAPKDFSNALEPSLTRLNTAVEKLLEHKGQSSIEAIEQLVEEFQRSLSGTATAQMEELARTVGNASQSLMSLPGQMEQMIGGVQEQIDQTRQLLAENAETQTEQMRSMMDGVLNAFQRTIETQQLGLSETTNQSIQMLQSTIAELQQSITSTASQNATESEAMTNRMRELLESAANRTDDQLAQRMADIETVSNQSIQTLQTAIAELQQSITSTASQTATESEAMTNRMRELLESVANRTDEQLEQRMADIETVSNQSIQTLQTAIAELGQSITSTLNQQQQTISAITSQTAQASAEATDRMQQLVNRAAIRLDESVQGAEESINILLQQQGDQIEAFNAQITNSQATLTRSREILEQMNTSVEGVRQLIETTRALSGQLTTSATQLESAGQQLTQASNAFNQENERYLTANRETTRQIQATLEESQQLLDNFTRRFQTIDNGLRSIFEQIEEGLDEYATTTRESINTYLRDFSVQLTQASTALAGSVEALNENIGTLVDMIERLPRR